MCVLKYVSMHFGYKRSFIVVARWVTKQTTYIASLGYEIVCYLSCLQSCGNLSDEPHNVILVATLTIIGRPMLYCLARIIKLDNTFPIRVFGHLISVQSTSQ